jgi:hypothetical protein
VWVAGRWPKRRPIRRAVAWDGYFPIDLPGPEALSELLAEVDEQRSQQSGPFDVIVEIEPGDDIGPWREAGATWILTGFGLQPEPDRIREAVRALER